MVKNKGYRCVCIKKRLIDEVENLIKDSESPIYGRYKSLAEFTTDALRRHLEHLRVLYPDKVKAA